MTDASVDRPIETEEVVPEEGFVFATTGKVYTDLARRAVRNLRQVMPDVAVDLFTDRPIEDALFDRVIPVENSWFRPKMEALRRSRFQRTVCLDSDLVIVADVSDMFEILKRFDVTGVHHQIRNWALGRTPSKSGAPACFPQMASGVMGVRKNDKTRKLLEDWERVLRETDGPKDQPILRDLLWDSDLRIHWLPWDYNLHHPIRALPHLESSDAAPRIIHYSKLQRAPYGDPETPFDLAEIAGDEIARHVAEIVAADASLSGDPERIVPARTASIRSVVRRRLPQRLRRPFAPPRYDR